MRDEWTDSRGVIAVRNEERSKTGNDSRSSQGLTRASGQGSNTRQVANGGGLDRSASLTLAMKKGMKLKGGKGAIDLTNREVSARRQTGDVEDALNQGSSMDGKGGTPWWRNVGMEEGL